MTPILDLPGIGPHLEKKLVEMGLKTVEQFAATSPTALAGIPGIGARRAEVLLEAARRITAISPKGPAKPRKTPARAKASKTSADAAAKTEVIAANDDATAPTPPKAAGKKADKKKAAKGKDPKKVKAKNKKESSKKKAKEKVAAAKKAAAKKAKKAAAKKDSARKKKKKNRKSKKK